MRFKKCKLLGRLYYDVAGEIDIIGGSSRAVSTALCLSKRVLQARAEAALLLSLMLNSHAPEAIFQLTPELLQNGTGLHLTRLARFQDFKLDWLVLGTAKCSTTSLQYNLGIHPDIRLKSTHATTFSHSLLYSSSRFLPLHSLQREFSSHLPSALLGHPDHGKVGGTTQGLHRPLVGCSLVADMEPAYEEGTGNILSSLRSDAAAEHFLYPFLLWTLLSAKPQIKMMYVVRDAERIRGNHFLCRCMRGTLFSCVSTKSMLTIASCADLSCFAIELVCSLEIEDGAVEHVQKPEAPCSTYAGRLALMTTSQTAEPKALAAAARFLGRSPMIYSTETARVQYMNLGKVRWRLREIFQEEYGRLAGLLAQFQLVDGSAEGMLAARDWTCPGD
ncbi:Uncharacterized protein SCF082_LOCUS8944 [Durusdinium trenchii]|uniref:Sulfotransferase n=1 Tax=Durusdinium trenchii TaxID=1381693 RepID=A0ABP0IVW0_9DINO